MPGSQVVEVPVPRGATLVSVDGRTYPLESARVDATAASGIACSTLRQVYRNPYAEPLEVIYKLPLPADGAVIGYTMRLGERVIRGEVRKRAEAKAAYDKALLEGRSAGLLEQDRDDTFSQRLGSLPAGQSAEITIEVLHPLGFLAGASGEAAQWEYRFPTVVGVRYQGEPGRVVDADRLDADRAGEAGQIPTRIELTLTITVPDGSEVKRVEPMPLDRDLVVRFPAGGAQIGAHLVEGPGLPGDGGRYGVVTITPPLVPQMEFARDLTLLIDASGSMSGKPIAWAKAVAGSLLQSLVEGDWFEIITFAMRPKALTNGLVPFSAQAVAQAQAVLAEVTAGGGTEMVSGVIEALRSLRPESQHQVVLITDGQIGFEHEVVSRILKELPDGARLHVVGVGAAPNRTLTLRAARAGRGVEAFVCGDEEVSATVARMIAATARPVLTDLLFSGDAMRGFAPARMRDVLAGQPVVVAVELTEGGGTIEVTGRLAGSASPWTWRIDVPPIAARQRASALPLGALYGRERVADVEMSGNDVNDHVTTIGLRHQIASRMTSLVAISEQLSVDPRSPRRREELAVEVPAFQSAEGLGLALSRDSALSRILGMASPSRAFSGRFKEVVASIPTRELARKLASTQIDFPALHQAKVISVQGDLLILEFESPRDGFVGPDEKNVRFQGRRPLSFVAELSSPPGLHARGLILRIAVRLGSGPWQRMDNVIVRWGDKDDEGVWAVVKDLPAA